ncbi:hypothetical protein BGZ61DRAFT_529434 [Ilyonectria robusta]|uniref:uncharacterized protein n=1 Tax=Ilyonectria robusta TaxID=1079257 RepID=UPI001E8DC8A2|nr:uncharacterized protein BGZ61DRAFT_529434 [Ilyonectria robusta]KAH8729187.1 hypothetical protein BGZ61DRAFT_529434 [Ilyonectria robusta]
MAASSRQMDSGAPLTRRFVAFGCIFEEDFPANLVACQAWSGCLSIRVANLKTWRGVVGTVNSDVTDLTCFTSVQETDAEARPPFILQPSFENNISAFASPREQIEFALSFQVGESARNVGFDIIHSSNHSQYTRVYFHPPSESRRLGRS